MRLRSGVEHPAVPAVRPDHRGVHAHRPLAAGLLDALPRDLPPVTGALRGLLPDLADRLPPAPPPLAEPQAEHHRVLRALCAMTAHLGDAVLAVEDLQWADAGTRAFLRTVVSDPPPRLGLVLTAREDGDGLPFPVPCAPRPTSRWSSSASRRCRWRRPGNWPPACSARGPCRRSSPSACSGGRAGCRTWSRRCCADAPAVRMRAATEAGQRVPPRAPKRRKRRKWREANPAALPREVNPAALLGRRARLPCSGRRARLPGSGRRPGPSGTRK
ncbi:hypothetical protein ID875_23265 [Streptomyces globisporus]|uniref:Orc1-like AAA ATPase domain-containing protein n=1 Tax=Streptomyces globisporus TaxID=1908 RepID=A0A927BLU5_STRGL|nr:hypothetical protein [Streptomyces globisporus]